MSKVMLKLQDPHDSDSVYLLENLLERFISARGGGGAFAWATAQGVELLLADEVFERFALKYPFDLIVGVDAITTPAALGALRFAEQRLPGLTVRIFYSPSDLALFHPKFAWFLEPDGGSIIVGSGNLTNGGLRQNWEAYSVIPLNRDDAADLQRWWASWKEANAPRLFPVDTPEVLQRAELNRRDWDGPRVTPTQPPGPDTVTELRVLIAEIPKAGNRWEQANFDKTSYEQFFGAKVGTQRRMLFQSITRGGTSLGPVESRPSVEVRSRNWRFELSAAAGMPYPTRGRPIGVFLRVRQRSFVYDIVMPSDSGYEALEKYLDEKWTGSKRNVRRIQAPVSDVDDLQTVKILLSASKRAFADEETG